MLELVNVYKYYKTDGQKKVILDHVSTKFERGHSYGLLGVNGAGKSTTMRLLAGVEYPNSGKIRRTARISWPLGFSSAFNPLMSGRHNVAFAARVYGQNVQRVIDFVEDFAELGDYLDLPVKTYSSGMGGRLAFGLSMAIEFECYLVDELTAVGDARFSAKCEKVFAERRERSDVIIVSHSAGTIKTFCDRGGVLVDGKMIMFSNVDDALDMYMRLNR